MSAKTTDLERQLETAANRIEKLERLLTTLQADSDRRDKSLRSNVQQLQHQIKDLQRRLANSELRVKNIDKELGQTQQDVRLLRATETKLRRVYGTNARGRGH